jgi:hypothetical protein
VNSSTDALVGEIVAERYKVLSHLGSGGFGSVYMAKHVKLNNPVAIKVMHPHLVANRECIARFEREAETTSRLKHSAIASVHDIGLLADGRPYMVMEYLSGYSLADAIESGGALPAERVVPLFVECCDALRYAHRYGLLHRDIKPDNIYIVRDHDGVEHAKLLDFGLAKLIFGDDTSRPSSLTESGITLGTPWYMSPEQCQAKPLDGRTDIYSLAYSLYEALAGHRAFAGRTHYEAMDAHLHSKVPRLNEEGKPPIVPQGLEDAIIKALSKAPNDRYSTADEFRDALASTISGVVMPIKTPAQAPVQLRRETLSAEAAKPDSIKGKAEKKDEMREILVGVATLALLILAVAAGAIWWHQNSAKEHAAQQPVPPDATTPTTASTPASSTPPAAVPASRAVVPAAVAPAPAATAPAPVVVAPAANSGMSPQQIQQLVEEEVRKREQLRQAQLLQQQQQQQLQAAQQRQPATTTTTQPHFEPYQFPESTLRTTRTYNQPESTTHESPPATTTSSRPEPPEFMTPPGFPSSWRPGDPIPPGLEPPMPPGWKSGDRLPNFPPGTPLPSWARQNQ